MENVNPARPEKQRNEEMKKLVFAAAMVAMGVAFGIESSNIVGYQNVATEAGGSELKGVMFQNVSSSTMKLSDIKMSAGCESTTLSRFIEMAWVQYTWDPLFKMNQAGDDVEEVIDPTTGKQKIGWGVYDDTEWGVTFALNEEVELGLGEGVLIQAQGTDPEVQVNGEVWKPLGNVAKAGRTVESGGSELISNVFPGSNYMLSTVEMSEGCDSTTLSRFVEMAWVQYTWDPLFVMNKAGDDVEEVTDPKTGKQAIGWGVYDDSEWGVTFALDSDIEISAGEGLLMQAQGTEPSVLFTNPFYVAE